MALVSPDNRLNAVLLTRDIEPAAVIKPRFALITLTRLNLQGRGRQRPVVSKNTGHIAFTYTFVCAMRKLLICSFLFFAFATLALSRI